MSGRKTIVAVLTPPGRAALSTIVVDGPGAEHLVARHFQPATGDALPLDRIRFGRWRHDRGEEVIVCRRPDHLEIHCHGGVAASQAIVDDLVRAGADCRDWQAWLDQTGNSAIRTEAHRQLVAACTERVARCLLDQYQGALSTAMKHVERSLATGRLPTAMRDLQALQQSARVGLHLATPWRVVIAGPPNVGKSSLINALVGYQRAIVHSTAGTTRDLLTAMTAIDGWALELTDTAGIHDAQDSIERDGMQRAIAASQAADLVILLEDATEPRLARWQPYRPGQSLIVVGNKYDLLQPLGHAATSVAMSNLRNPDLLVSAKTGAAIDQLVRLIGERLVPSPPRPGQAIVFTQRQLRLIEDAMRGLDNASVDAALTAVRRLDAMDDLLAAAAE